MVALLVILGCTDDPADDPSPDTSLQDDSDYWPDESTWNDTAPEDTSALRYWPFDDAVVEYVDGEDTLTFTVASTDGGADYRLASGDTTVHEFSVSSELVLSRLDGVDTDVRWLPDELSIGHQADGNVAQLSQTRVQDWTFGGAYVTTTVDIEDGPALRMWWELQVEGQMPLRLRTEDDRLWRQAQE